MNSPKSSVTQSSRDYGCGEKSRALWLSWPKQERTSGQSLVDIIGDFGASLRFPLCDTHVNHESWSAATQVAIVLREPPFWPASLALWRSKGLLAMLS